MRFLLKYRVNVTKCDQGVHHAFSYKELGQTDRGVHYAVRDQGGPPCIVPDKVLGQNDQRDLRVHHTCFL